MLRLLLPLLAFAPVATFSDQVSPDPFGLTIFTLSGWVKVGFNDSTGDSFAMLLDEKGRKVSSVVIPCHVVNFLTLRPSIPEEVLVFCTQGGGGSSYGIRAFYVERKRLREVFYEVARPTGYSYVPMIIQDRKKLAISFAVEKGQFFRQDVQRIWNAKSKKFDRKLGGVWKIPD